MFDDHVDIRTVYRVHCVHCGYLSETSNHAAALLVKERHSCGGGTYSNSTTVNVDE